MITIKIEGITVEINDEVSSSKLSQVEVAELAINNAMSEVSKLRISDNPMLTAILDCLDESKSNLQSLQFELLNNQVNQPTTNDK